MNLTNQELIQELEKRIKEGSLKAQVIADEFEEQKSSLFSYLDGKSLLLLVGLTAAGALLFCHYLRVTSSKVTSVKIEFDQHPPVKISGEMKEEK